MSRDKGTMGQTQNFAMGQARTGFWNFAKGQTGDRTKFWHFSTRQAETGFWQSNRSKKEEKKYNFWKENILTIYGFFDICFPDQIVILFWDVPGQRTFVPGFFLLLLSRNKGTTRHPFLVCLGTVPPCWKPYFKSHNPGHSNVHLIRLCIYHNEQKVSNKKFRDWVIISKINWYILTSKKLSLYRVSEGKVVFLIWLWEKEIYKLDYVWR